MPSPLQFLYHSVSSLFSSTATHSPLLSTNVAQHSMSLPTSPKEKEKENAVKIGSSDRADEDITPCHFLDLPAEMRNRIYREVLTTPERIPINSTFQIPGLLCANKQIHDEAKPIFCLENKFSADILQMDSSLILKFLENFVGSKFAKKVSRRLLLEIHTMGRKIDWLRVLSYMKLDFEGHFVGTRFSTKGRGAFAVRRAFKMAHTLRGKLSWADVVDTLELYRLAMQTQARGRWLWV